MQCAAGGDNSAPQTRTARFQCLNQRRQNAHWHQNRPSLSDRFRSSSDGNLGGVNSNTFLAKDGRGGAVGAVAEGCIPTPY